LPTYRLLIEYEGSGFHGWQIQPNGPTVQKALEDALEVILRTPVNVVGSGRTDAGVHARGQVAHFRFGGDLDVFKLTRSLNSVLPDSVVVLAAELAPDGFHARYDAIRRTYFYHIATEPRALDRSLKWELRASLDFDLMSEAAQALIGTRDFNSFCITQSETKNRVCSIERAVWIEERRPNDWRFEIAADRFLHGMVRTIVGTLVEIGRGKRPPNDMDGIIAAMDRRSAGQAAPAHGLVLERVDYPEPIFFETGTDRQSSPSIVPNSGAC